MEKLTLRPQRLLGITRKTGMVTLREDVDRTLKGLDFLPTLGVDWNKDTQSINFTTYARDSDRMVVQAVFSEGKVQTQLGDLENTRVRCDAHLYFMFADQDTLNSIDAKLERHYINGI